MTASQKSIGNWIHLWLFLSNLIYASLTFQGHVRVVQAFLCDRESNLLGDKTRGCSITNSRLETHLVSMPLLISLEGMSVNLGDTVETGDKDNVKDLEGMFCSGPSIPWNYYRIVEPDVTNCPDAPCCFALHSPQQCEKGKSALIPSTTSSTNSQPNERLTDMQSGSGTPLQDPLNYVGHLNLSEELNPDHSPSISSNHPLLDTLSLAVITVPYHTPSTDDQLSLPPNIHLASNWGHHLLFSDERKDIFTLEAAHLNSYVTFGCYICRSPKFRSPALFVYGYFTDLWNDTDHLCGFLLQNADGIWAPEGDPISHNLFMAIYHDSHHDSLCKAELIHKDDSVNNRLLASWKTAANICIKCQLHDQERIQRQQDTRCTKKQATIHGVRLVEAQEHAAAESCCACSKHEAHKQQVNNAKCDYVELDITLSTSHSCCKPAIIAPAHAPDPAPVVISQTAQFTQLVVQLAQPSSSPKLWLWLQALPL